MRATVWQQVAEIVAIREQIGRPVSKQLSDLACPADDQKHLPTISAPWLVKARTSAAPTILLSMYWNPLPTIQSPAASRTLRPVKPLGSDAFRKSCLKH